MNCPLCKKPLADLKTKTATVCRRCVVTVDAFHEGTIKAIHPPAGYEILPDGVEIIPGDIHFVLKGGPHEQQTI